MSDPAQGVAVDLRVLKVTLLLHSSDFSQVDWPAIRTPEILCCYSKVSTHVDRERLFRVDSGSWGALFE